MGTLTVVRHGATAWSLAGKHTGRTDLPLLPEGEEQARALVPRLAGTPYALVLTSPRQRARRTAELAGFPDAVVDDDLGEWDYGDYEGVTTDEIREHDPDWTVWTGRLPGGESAEAFSVRLDRVIARAQAVDGPVLAFSHGHCLRALAARWLGLPVGEGRLWHLDTATVSELGAEREQAVLLRWNA